MEEKFVATTVEMDKSGFADLQDQILNSKNDKSEPEKQEKEVAYERKRETSSPNKKYVFKKGDQSLELDDDYEIEIMADKRPTRMTLKELKDRAAGDIAVKNRMHSLAEERKRVQDTYKKFAEIAETDPLGALEFISNKAKEVNSNFEYGKYIEKLAEQAEKLGKMDEKERKAWELEKKLNKAEQDLSQKERETAVVLRKQHILMDYPEIGDSQFSQMVDAILSHEEISGDLEDENDVMDKVEELIQETLTQRDIMSVIQEINPDHLNDNELIFALSDQLRQNPDLDEEDVRDILSEILRPVERVRNRAPQKNAEREREIRTLSNKARQATPVDQMRTQNMSSYDLLKEQLLERKQELSKTPLNKR